MVCVREREAMERERERGRERLGTAAREAKVGS